MRLWDAASGEELVVLRGHESGVTSVAFSPDGWRVASGSSDETVRLWDAASGEELLVLCGHEKWVTSVAFSPDGSRIASGSRNGTVRLWDASSGEELAVLRGHEGHDVSSVAFSPDGSRIASAARDKTVRLWDASSGQELRVLRGHDSSVTSVAFSPDGSRIASGSSDYTVRLWDTIAYRDRIAERDDARRAEQTMSPFVDELFGKGLDCSAVAERVRTDETLSDPLRHAAINLVLKRCSAIREQADSLIDDLQGRLIFAADIQAAVQENTSLEPVVRAEAIRIARLIEDTPRRLNAYAWKLLTVEPVDLRDPTAALPVAIEANEMTGHEIPAYLDTLAMAYHLTGDHAKAVETQQKAIALLTPDIPNRDEYEDHLAQFKAALPKE